jgi:hypothetical protein
MRLALIALPLIALGWTIGQYRLFSDDWTMIDLVLHTGLTNIDPSRPLLPVQRMAAFYLAGGNVDVMILQSVLLHAIEALLAFEVLRRVLAAWQPDRADWFAMIGAAIYVIYPSDVSRHMIIMQHGRYLQISTLLLFWLWITAAQRNQPRLLGLAMLLVLCTVLIKENTLFVYGWMPLIPLYFGVVIWRSPWRNWIGAWYGLLALYSGWRLVFLQNPNAVIRGRTIEFPDSLQAVIEPLWLTLGNITWELPLTIYREHQRALTDGSPLSGLPIVALIGSAMVIGLIAWRVRFNADNLGLSEPRKRSAPIALFAFALMIYVSGVFPHILNGLRELPIEHLTSRHTQVPIFAIALGITVMVMLPRRYNLAIGGIVCGLVVSAAIVRQVHAGEDYIRSWQAQQTFWSEMLALPIDIRSEPTEYQSLLLLYQFPVRYGNALATTNSWAYQSAFRILTDAKVIAHPINETGGIAGYEDRHLRFNGWRRLTADRRIPIEQVRLVDYQADTGSVRLLTEMPRDLLPTGVDAIPLYTGFNRIDPGFTLTTLGESLLRAMPPDRTCQTSVTVQSVDQATMIGDALVIQWPERHLIDRRRIQVGESLGYRLSAPCGVGLRVWYQPDQGERISLPASIEYQTTHEAISPLYETSFEAAQPAP